MTKNSGSQQMSPLKVQSCLPGRSPCIQCHTVHAHQRLFWLKTVNYCSWRRMAGEWRFVTLQSCALPKSAVNAGPVGRLTAEIGMDC